MMMLEFLHLSLDRGHFVYILNWRNKLERLRACNIDK